MFQEGILGELLESELFTGDNHSPEDETNC